MKYEWRKKDKVLYLPKNEPTIIDVPEMQYLSVTGEGNPGDEAFADCVGALYAMSYGLKMLPKGGITPEGYFEYTVFPLEGVWDLNEEGRRRYEAGAASVELKDYFIYKVMIRQPDFVDSDLVEMVRASVMKKKKNPRIADIRLELITEGKAVQMMHLGSYDDEPASFDQMETFAEEKGLKRVNRNHKEIYLTNPDKVSPEKMKTTIRMWVEQEIV